ncbi:MAG: patatin-like phospholipase family protein [Bacteroidales bacterium]
MMQSIPALKNIDYFHHMNKAVAFLSVCMVWLVCTPQVFSQNGDHRPKIGLVLSGGGAKGLAHIGAIKVLEEAGIKPDYIAGTSMGSIVGALYAIGYSPGQIEAIARSINWNELLNDEVLRRNISIEEKDEDGKYVAQFRIRNGKVVLPRGLINGYKISLLLSTLTWSVHTINTFNRFPIPFRCIATDIETIEPVVLTEGFLPDALRASMAIPSIFTPVELNGRLLVDGGVVRNLPAQDVKEMGADIIIGIDVTADLKKKDEINSAFEILDQASTYPIAISNARQRKLCDILISPEVKNYTSFSFSATDTLIRLGEAAARKQWDKLVQLADSLRKWPEKKTVPVNPRQFTAILVRNIDVEGLQKVSNHVVYGNLGFHEGDSVTLHMLRQGIERIYGTQFFQNVTYMILPDSSGNRLVIRVKEQEFNFVKFSFNYNNDFKSAVLLNATYRNVLGEGSRMLGDLRLSENPSLKLHYTVHTRWRPNIGFSQMFVYNIFDAPYYSPIGEKITTFNYRHLFSETEFRSVFSNSLMAGAGITVQQQVTDARYDPFDSLNVRIRSWKLTGRVLYDNLDVSVFPRMGGRSEFRLEHYFGIDSKEDNNHLSTNFWTASFSSERLISVYPRFSFLAGITAGITEAQTIDPIHYFYLGGENPYEPRMFSFPGMPLMGTSGLNLFALKFGIQAEPWRDVFLFFRMGATELKPQINELWKNPDFKYGIETGAGTRTIIGPVYLLIGSNTITRKMESRLNIGFRF